jgi:hypothetical protein
MAVMFGVGVAPSGTESPVAGVGPWRRFVLSGPQFSTIKACAEYHAQGGRVLGIVTRQVTVEQAGGSSAQTARRILDLFGGSCDAIQVWNEPDGGGQASDIASVAVYNDWLAAFRTAFDAVGWRKPRIAAGLVSGQPDYLRGVHMDGYLLAIHPYDQRPYAGYPDWGWGNLPDLLDAYRPYLPAGTGFWLTECSRTTTDEALQARYAAALVEAVRGRTDVAVCLWYCWRDWMLGTERQPFGLTRMDGSAKPTLGAWVEAVQEGEDMASLEERIAQLEKQQNLQSEAIAAMLADHYADGPASAKGLLVQLNPPKYENLKVQEKQDLA